MKKLSRREFLSKSAIGLGGVTLAAQLPYELQGSNPVPALNMPFGFQIWTIKDALQKDFPGTLKKMADLGYQTVEMCSPPGYGFKPLMSMTAKEMKKIFDDTGLKCVSCHYGMKELRENLDERVAFALEVGQTQMIFSSFGVPRDAKLDDWKKAADELNQIGLKAKKGGIQMGFHNHNNEFATIDGVLIYDALMQQFDPEYIKMQFQVAVITIGYKAVDYFKKYPGRFISVHLADYAQDKKTAVPIGKGIVDWKELFSSLGAGGVKNIFAEIPEANFKESADYLKSI
jgi:sugar phosphate isomerase/epimerase